MTLDKMILGLADESQPIGYCAVESACVRCAKVVESWGESDTVASIVAAIRATGTDAAYRGALASAAAHFGGTPVPPGAPTIADALSAGERVLRDMLTGTDAAGGERE